MSPRHNHQSVGTMPCLTDWFTMQVPRNQRFRSPIAIAGEGAPAEPPPPIPPNRLNRQRIAGLPSHTVHSSGRSPLTPKCALASGGLLQLRIHNSATSYAASALTAPGPGILLRTASYARCGAFAEGRVWEGHVNGQPLFFLLVGCTLTLCRAVPASTTAVFEARPICSCRTDVIANATTIIDQLSGNAFSPTPPSGSPPHIRIG